MKSQNGILSQTALKLIKFYQRYISPHKGFSCAHRIHHGGVGCSGYGFKVFSKFSFFTALKLLRRRLDECSLSAKTLKAQRAENEILKKTGLQLQQGGFVDCGGCDVPAGDCACDVPSCDLPSCNAATCEEGWFGRMFSFGCDFLSCGPDCGDCSGSSSSSERAEERKAARQARRDKKKTEEENDELPSSNHGHDDGEGDF